MSDFRRRLACEVDEAADAGFVLMSVSVFDHRLTEAELVDQEKVPFLFHREAREKGMEAQFLDIERRFVALLDRLAAGGVALIHRPARIHPLRAQSARYRSLVRRALREKHTNDLYFPGFEACWIFGRDMTHWVILPDASRVEQIKGLVRDAGLHVLRVEGA